MQLIRNLWKQIAGEGGGLYSFERAAIEQVAAGLGGAGLQLLRQMEAINKVQRMVSGKEVNLYRMRNGSASFEEDLRFTGMPDEALLATVWFMHPHQGRRRLKLEMWLAKARLFSLIYDKAPGAFFAGEDLGAVLPEVADLRICLDLSPGRESSANQRNVRLTGWPLTWVEQGLLTRLRSPVPEAERERTLESIDALLPADYRELATQTDGGQFRACFIHGPGKIRKIVSPEANYYVLAECSKSALAVREGSRRGLLFVMHYEDDITEEAGVSFRKAVERLADVDDAS